MRETIIVLYQFIGKLSYTSQRAEEADKLKG